MLNDAAASAAPAPERRKRTGRKAGIIHRPLSAGEWKVMRAQYESGSHTCAQLAAIFNTSLATVYHRQADEKWKRGSAGAGAVVLNAREELQSAATAAMKQAAAGVAEKLARDLTAELAPWIEKEKRQQIRRAIKRSKAAQRRLDGVSEGYSVYDAKKGEVVALEPSPKDESYLASSEEKYDSIIRRNLGMDDTSAPAAGRISLRMLAGPVAIEVSTG